MIVQGDIFFVKEAIPKGAKSRKHDGRLKEGESTGHCHKVAAPEKVEFYEKDGVLYLRVKEKTTVEHEEHNPVTLEPGDYRFDSQIEDDPFDDEIREIKD